MIPSQETPRVGLVLKIKKGGQVLPVPLFAVCGLWAAVSGLRLVHVEQAGKDHRCIGEIDSTRFAHHTGNFLFVCIPG